MKRTVALTSGITMVALVACTGSTEAERVAVNADLGASEIAPTSLVSPPAGTYVCEIDVSELIPTVSSRAANVRVSRAVFNPNLCDIRFTLIDTCTCVAPIKPNPACAGPTACMPNVASATGFVYDYAQNMTSVPAPPTGQVYDVACNLSPAEIAVRVAREIARRAGTWSDELRAECTAACTQQFRWQNAVNSTQRMLPSSAQCLLPSSPTTVDVLAN